MAIGGGINKLGPCMFRLDLHFGYSSSCISSESSAQEIRSAQRHPKAAALRSLSFGASTRLSHPTAPTGEGRRANRHVFLASRERGQRDGPCHCLNKGLSQTRDPAHRKFVRQAGPTRMFEPIPPPPHIHPLRPPHLLAPPARTVKGLAWGPFLLSVPWFWRPGGHYY